MDTKGPHRGGKYMIDLGCRVFARVGNDTVTFFCAEMHGNAAGRSVFWDQLSLEKACKDYIREKLKTICINLDRTLGKALQHDTEEMSISQLPHPIVSGILLILDVDSQVQTRRVCALWRLLSRNCINNRHFIFDLCSTCQKKPHEDASLKCYSDYRSYKLVTVLDGILPGRTHTLTQDGNHVHTSRDAFVQQRMWTVQRVLEAKGIRLPVVIVKNGRDCIESPLLTVCHDSDTDTFEYPSLSPMMSVCEELVLSNYNAWEAILRSALEILHWDTGTTSALPLSEMVFTRCEYDGRCDIIIPLLRFRAAQTAVEQSRLFLAAANQHCMPASQRVLGKVTAIHGRWVQTLAYPEEWISIRIFLKLFNSFHRNYHPQHWNTMDLRLLDVTTLTNVTFAVLDAFFED
ncbi:uncharacterized protein LOC129599251 isoform X2 [Paramacrobiotus metropolitanus]|uniref:uncharacterized protein LOC129599251 isoform X2 n=1 Tax=Paramacrobiotus metropolitanus TaxID=2943436 RepID=UPI0024460FC0|nr:uncharacterized protein LOC129599251 isoform X2 [Paramacrobiotus metropolitanus]